MSRFQNKMYNHEETPPAYAWEQISDALNESQLENKFPSTLYDIEVKPPAGTWGKIADALDEESLQNQFSSKLYNMEVPPPATAWEKVAAGLVTPVKPIATPVKKLSPFLRYAAAAIFIGAIAFSIFKLTVDKGNEESNTALATAPRDSSVNNKVKPADTGAKQTPHNVIIDEDDAVLEKSKKLLAKVGHPSKRTTSVINSTVIASNGFDEYTEAGLSQSIYAYADHVPDIADRYVMLMTPDGNIIRMSKKWSDLLCCVSGEEQDTDCKYQLKKWQEKMATSALAPSPGNFLDILGLVNSLDDSNGL